MPTFSSFNGGQKSPVILAQCFTIQVCLFAIWKWVRQSHCFSFRIRLSLLKCHTILINCLRRYECGRTFELLSLGCIVIMPEIPGFREQYSHLPVAFVTTDPHLQQQVLRERNERLRQNLQHEWHDDVPLVTSFDGLTVEVLAAIGKALGPLASDVKRTRYYLSPAYWASRFRSHLSDGPQD